MSLISPSISVKNIPFLSTSYSLIFAVSRKCNSYSFCLVDSHSDFDTVNSSVLYYLHAVSPSVFHPLWHCSQIPSPVAHSDEKQIQIWSCLKACYDLHISSWTDDFLPQKSSEFKCVRNQRPHWHLVCPCAVLSPCPIWLYVAVHFSFWTFSMVSSTHYLFSVWKLFLSLSYIPSQEIMLLFFFPSSYLSTHALLSLTAGFLLPNFTSILFSKIEIYFSCFCTIKAYWDKDTV